MWLTLVSFQIIGIENVYGIFEDWSPEPINDLTKRAYEKALQKLSLCMDYEESLVSVFVFYLLLLFPFVNG